MRKAVRAWLYEEADWYEFWKPRSGVAGGAIMGVLIVFLLQTFGVL